ncbi:unnamed protein product [Protopolystoma xenopodis]|uniref:Uncharacterized protein n=1 Tax=Protopolystoma xenopodis TaxID=117903 RepID=A0A3S5BMC0_9PLAT|nr:unnamed protein product [Protopolystoma xenopodis]
MVHWWHEDEPGKPEESLLWPVSKTPMGQTTIPLPLDSVCGQTTRVWPVGNVKPKLRIVSITRLFGSSDETTGDQQAPRLCLSVGSSGLELSHRAFICQSVQKVIRLTQFVVQLAHTCFTVRQPQRQGLDCVTPVLALTSRLSPSPRAVAVEPSCEAPVRLCKPHWAHMSFCTYV